MLSDGTWTYTWEHGRELTSMSDGTTTWCYEYNADGLRTKRSNGTTTYEYIYNGSSLVQMTVGDDTLYFAPDSVIYNGATYYYVTNIQGDVVEILDARGYTVVIYNYDAWGNILTTSGSMANTLGKINPITYRGYVYDAETRLYYLQSRYYDPEIGRFINADDTAYLVADRTLLSYNLFAYCKNNPVTGCDPTGHFGLVGAIIATSAIVGGLLGAFSAAATGGNVLEGAIEGCLTGALGATCGLFLNPLVAGAVAFVGGAIIDIGTQAATQYITTQEVNLEEIDPWRAAKVGLETSIGAVIPALGDAAGNAVDAFDTALIWAEASTIITCVDVAVTNTVTATHTSTRKASTNQCSIAIHGRKMLLI